MLKRTRRTLGAAELRRALGLARLPGMAIACVGGEWRQEGARWRFWRDTAGETRAAPSTPDGAPEPWWNR